MKKNFVWIMILSLLLSGCGGPAAPVTTEPPTVPQIPETTTPVETTVMPTAEPIVEKTEEEIKAEIAELFVSRTVLENWYNNALFSTYENTSELDIFEMFRDGYSNGKATQEELDFLGSKLGRSIDPSKVGRITGAEMDEVLMQVFGKIRDQFDLNHEKIYCFEKTEPVYLWVRTVGRTSDCNVQDIIVNGDTVEVVHAIYDDLFLVTLQWYENRWIITSHQPYVPPLYTLPEGAVELTAEQIEQVNAAFPAEAVIDSEGRMAFGSAQAFLNCFYEKPEDIDLGIFLRYFSVEAVAPERVGLKADQAQFDQLRDQHGWWEHITDINKMPVPIHRYLREDVDAVMRRYTGVPLSELDDKGLSYLSEYDSYYNTTSDAGMACMNCVGGYITEDGAVLYRDPEGVFYRQENGELDITYGYTVLILRLSQEDGKYYIVSHLPLATE